MRFNEAVDNVGRFRDLKRFASAHVVDYSNLREQELRPAIKKVRPQYLHHETVANSIEQAFYNEEDLTKRVVSKIILRDVLLEEVGFTLPANVLEEKVISFEQKMIDRSNELDIVDLAGSKKTGHFRDLELYNFVLGVAWEYRETKSPDEANLLRRLRNKLGISEYEHRLLETKLGKFPKANNEIHTRCDISSVRQYLQGLGLLLAIKDDSNEYYDIIPEELAEVIRDVVGAEMRTEGYELLLARKELKKKVALQKILAKSGYEILPYDSTKSLVEKVLRRVRPSEALSTLTADQLYQICSELGIHVTGSKEEKISRIVGFYDKMQIKTKEAEDEREVYFEHYAELAFRNRELLRAKGLIDKDLEIEHHFEEATRFIFEKLLNHTPLVQPGANRPDGLISFKDMYLMWDNKSKEEPGQVNLRDHLNQFNGYMDHSDKPVPVFMVIAPNFTPESEICAIKYSSEHINRNILLITASELAELAEMWSSEKNKRREEPFPLGLFVNSGRFKRGIIGQLI
jgi:hypothetical protein